MDPNYKPPSSLDKAKLPSRKPSPRFSMVTNVSTTPGHSPHKSHPHENIKSFVHHLTSDSQRFQVKINLNFIDHKILVFL